MNKSIPIMAAGVTTAAIISAGAIWLGRDDAKGDTPGAEIGRALPTAPANGERKVAATVNGRPIYATELEAAAVAQQGSTGGSDALQTLIDHELLLEEGRRLGLEPSEAEVAAAVKANRADAESPEGATSRRLIEEYIKRTGTTWDEYWTSTTVSLAWKRTLTLSRVREKLGAAATTQADRQAAVEVRLAELRKSAKIERFDP